LRVVIVGGGASGLFLASLLKKDYILLDKGDKIGRKIEISGGGRCNITNKKLSGSNYRGDKEFILNAFKHFDNNDTLKWLKKSEINVYEKKQNQYFLDSSRVLIDYFKKNVKNISYNTEVTALSKDGVKTSKGEIKADYIVFASGGVSYKKLGVSDIALKTASKTGHRVEPFKPALVGFSVQRSEFWFKNLSGVSIEAKVKVNERVYNQNILFSHRGITGPAILNASLWWERGEVEIDFLKQPVKRFLIDKKKQISTQLPLPKRFVKEFLKSVGMEDKKVYAIKRDEWEKLKKLNSYKFAPAGTFGFERAEVSKGGVEVDEINEFMQSRLDKRLFFIGEALNVTGELGGYNFQWAFSSAYNAYRFLKNEL